MAKRFKGSIEVETNITLPNATGNRALTLDASGNLTESATTDTELGYLSGLTSDAQTQLDAKLDDFSGTTGTVVLVDSSGAAVQGSSIAVDGSSNITGVNNLTVTGDLTVNGTTTTINTTNLDVTDANITVNNGGNQASADAQDAGITVEMSDATDAKIGYDSTLTSKFHAGEVGSEAEIATTSHSQTLTNKTIDADNNTISNLAHGAEVDDPSSGVHGVTGSVVGTTDTQTLTNKTIDADNNTISNLAHGAEVDDPSSGVHGVTGDVVGNSDTQTLTNKTIVAASNTITTAASGNLTSTELDAALAELQTDVDGRATTELDNLGTTAINAHLLPDGNGTRDLGSFSGIWRDAHMQQVALYQGSNLRGSLAASGTVVKLSGASTTTGFEISNSTNVTGTDIDLIGGSASTGTGGDVSITTGDSASSTAGDISLTTGTGTGSVRGKVKVVDGSEGTAGHVLTSSGTGGEVTWAAPASGGSAGDIDETSFSGAESASGANVTGLAFANATVRSFKAMVTIEIDATADLFESYELSGVQRGADWVMEQSSIGDDSLVTFAISAAGQVTYSSTTYAGFVTMDIKFRAETLTV